MSPVFIIDAKRTAIGKFLGVFNELTAIDLATLVLKNFLSRFPFLRDSTEEVIVGNVIAAGLGQNPARIAAHRAGISSGCAAYTVNHVCGSGLAAIIQGARAIALEEADVVIAGGMESMSNAPHLLFDIRGGVKVKNLELVDSLQRDGLHCGILNTPMGTTAETIAERYKVSRREQDEYALESHRRSVIATTRGYFTREIVPVVLSHQSNPVIADEQPRSDTSVEKLSALRPVFKDSGTVTAGNSSSVNDGSAYVVLASGQAVKKYSLIPLAKILGYKMTGYDPEVMGLAPIDAIQPMLRKVRMTTKDIDLFEINEAFASQMLAILRLMKLNHEKVNASGGAIALGHPLGASGARILTTLLYNLKRMKRQYGVASLCIGGGQGVAMLIENL